MSISSISLITYPSTVNLSEAGDYTLVTKGFAKADALGAVATKWESKGYDQDTIVSYNGKFYKATETHSTASTPGSNGAKWEEFSFDTILSSISSAVSGVTITSDNTTALKVTQSGTTFTLSPKTAAVSSGAGTLVTGGQVYTYLTNNSTNAGGSGKGGKFVKLDDSGLIAQSMLPAIAITTATASTTEPSSKQSGDVWINTTNNTSYIYDGTAWQELLSPLDGVTSVNGYTTSSVTLSASDVGAVATSAITTSITSSSDNNSVPGALAVYSFVNGGYAAKSHTHTSANITGTLTKATDITDSATALVQGKAVYAYAAPVSHTHTSANISDAVSASSGITSGSSYLVKAGAVYDYAATKSHTHTSGNITGTLTTSAQITDSATALVQGKAVYAYAAPVSHTHTSANISDSISTSGGITSSETKLVQAKAVQAYVASAVGGVTVSSIGAAASSHTHTSANITDSIDASSGITNSAAGLVQGKAVYNYAAPKTHSHSNYITTSVNNLTNYSTTTAMNTAIGTAVNNALSCGSANVKFARVTKTLTAASTSTTITHTLGCSYLMVQVYQGTTPVMCDWTATDDTTITLNFATTVANGTTFTVLIVAFPVAS